LNERKKSYPNLAICLAERDGRAYVDGGWEAGRTSNRAENRDPTEFGEKDSETGERNRSECEVGRAEWARTHSASARVLHPHPHFH
jgi:hypothetical protein